MKRIAVLIVVAAVVAAIAAPLAGAKPLEPGPAYDARVPAAPAQVDPGWPGIVAGVGIAVVAVGGGILLATRWQREAAARREASAPPIARPLPSPSA